MSVREGRAVRARRRAAEQILTAGKELRLSRQLSGLSIRHCSEATGISASAWSRLELGGLADITLERLAIAANAVGLAPSLKLYPAGDPLRDAAQNALLERLHVRIHPSLGWKREVPLPGDRDLRSWGAVISKSRRWRPVDAETRLIDFQALERRINLKMRDGDAANIILLVADTRHNRAALRSAAEAWASAFPIRTRPALRGLASGHLPELSALIVL